MITKFDIGQCVYFLYKNSDGIYAYKPVNIEAIYIHRGEGGIIETYRFDDSPNYYQSLLFFDTEANAALYTRELNKNYR